MVQSRRDHPQSGSEVGAIRKSPPRFVLTGTFHGLNRGDSAMQLAAAHALRDLWPEARITVHSPHPDDDRELYKDMEVVPCARRRPAAALGALTRAILWRATAGRAPLSPELQSYRNASAVIDLSGDGLTETFGWRCPVSHTVPLLLACLLRVPFCLMAQTIGPFRRWRRWFRWVFSRAAFISARDDETFRYLSAWSLPCPVERTADVAFLLEPGSRADAMAYLQSLGNFDPSKPILAITPSNLYNVRAARPGTSADLAYEYLGPVASACNALAGEAGVQVLVVPHVFGPGESYDDRRAAETLAAGLHSRPLMVRESLSAPQLKALIACSEVFVGIRMHSVIAATSQAVPTLAIAYSPKLSRLMERLEMGQFALDLARLTVDDLTAMLGQLWGTRLATRATLQKVLSSDIFPAARRNFAAFERYILASASKKTAV